jgi:hypothetical protein
MVDNGESYTRREIDLFIVNLSQKFDLWDTKLDNIHNQVNSINGRVSCNAADINKLKSWKDRLIGGMSIITIIVIPMMVYIIKLWFR